MAAIKPGVGGAPCHTGEFSPGPASSLPAHSCLPGAQVQWLLPHILHVSASHGWYSAAFLTPGSLSRTPGSCWLAFLSSVTPDTLFSLEAFSSHSPLSSGSEQTPPQFLPSQASSPQPRNTCLPSWGTAHLGQPQRHCLIPELFLATPLPLSQKN